MGQGGGAERQSSLEKEDNRPLIQAPGAREAAPSEALPDSAAPGPRARAALAEAISPSSSDSVMPVCRARLQGHLF